MNQNPTSILGLSTRSADDFNTSPDGGTTSDFAANMILLDKVTVAKQARVSTTIAPGLTAVDLLWQTPFQDDLYFVLFPNPPFAPGAVTPIPPANTRTDNFAAIDSHFAAQFGTFSIASGKLQVSSVDGGNNRASMGWVEAGNWHVNQSSEVQITATALGSGGLGPAVNVADGSFYGFYIDSGIAYLFKQAGTLTTVLNSVAATLALNDVLRLEIEGQTLLAKQNGVAILTAFEAVPLPTGNPGVQGYQISALRANNWKGENLPVPVVILPVVLGPWIYLSTGLGIRMTVQNLNTTPLQIQIDAVAVRGL